MSQKSTHTALRAQWWIRALAAALIGFLTALALAGPASAAPDPNTTSNAAVTTSPCGVATDNSVAHFDADIGSGVIGSLTGMASKAATTALCFTLSRIDIGTSPELHEGTGGSWFDAMYAMFWGMALWVVAPLLMIATIHTLFRGSMALLLKIYFVFLPLAIIGGVVAVGITQLMLTATDDFSKGFINSIESSATYAFSGVAQGFTANGVLKGAGNSVPLILVIIAAILLAISCSLVYILLVMREAAVYMSVAFIPISLAFFVWPATAGFFKKLAEFIAALIFSKLVMVAGIALAVAAMASALQPPPSGDNDASVNGGSIQVASATGNDDGPDWFAWMGQTMMTTVMFGCVALAPAITFRMMARVAMPNMGHQASEFVQRPQHGRHLVALNRNLNNLGMLKDWRDGRIMLREKREAAKHVSEEGIALGVSGVFPGVDGTYHIEKEGVDARGIVDDAMRNRIMTFSRSKDPNEIQAAHYALAIGATSWTTNRYGYTVLHNRVTNESLILGDVVDRTSRKVRNGILTSEKRALLRSIDREFDNGVSGVRVIVPDTRLVQEGNSARGYLPGAVERRDTLTPLELVNAVNTGVASYNSRNGTNKHARVIIEATTTANDRMRAGSGLVGDNAGYHDF